MALNLFYLGTYLNKGEWIKKSKNMLKLVTDDSLQRRYIRELESNSEDLANSWLRIMPRALR
jgi:hypothetical protein